MSQPTTSQKRRGRSRVFVSFSSRNLDACAEVQRRLAQGGIEAWTYPGNIPPTEEFPAVITRQIEKSDVLLLLLSTDANNSPHVRREVHLALDLERRIVVFRLDNCKLHPALAYDLSGVQQVNSPTRDWSRETEALVAAVRATLALPSLHPRFRWLRNLWHGTTRTLTDAWNFSRTFSLVLLLLLLAVGGVGLYFGLGKWFAPPVATHLDLTCAPEPSSKGAEVVFRAVVRAEEATPEGAVEFQIDNRVKKVVPVLDGKAEWPVANLEAGQHEIAATFHPSGRFARSTAQVTHRRLVPTTVTLTGTPNPAPERTEVVLRARVGADDPQRPEGHLEVRDGERPLKPIPVVDGAAELRLADLTAGTHPLSATFFPAGRFARSTTAAPYVLTVVAATAAVPNRHGVIEVAASGVRALAVTMKPPEKKGERWTCTRATSREQKLPGHELRFDPTNKELPTDDSVTDVVAGVRELADWLEKKEGVPGGNVHIVVGSGVQGPSSNNRCGGQVAKRLREEFPRYAVKTTTRKEEALCLAQEVLASEANDRKEPKKVMVIDVGRDNLKATLVNPADPDEDLLVSIDSHIFGSRSLDRWTRVNARLPAVVLNTPEQRGAYAEQLRQACLKTVKEGLTEEADRVTFAWPDTYVLGEAAWAVCCIGQPNLTAKEALQKGRLKLAPGRLAATLADWNKTLLSPAFDQRASEFIKGHNIPPEQLLAAAQILQTLNESVNVGKSYAVTVLDSGRYDWLFHYLERAVGPAGP